MIVCSLGTVNQSRSCNSLQEPPKEQPETSKEDDGSSDDFDHHRTTAFTPYSDNPDVERGQSNEEMLQMQQQMMDGTFCTDTPSNYSTQWCALQNKTRI